ncbi:MAG: hypothetical protein ACYTG6_13750, partial [Planctomycetota bacterium]
MSRRLTVLSVVFVVVAASSCGSEDARPRSFRTPGGVRVDVLAEGTGPRARPGDHLALRYAAFHAEGT